MAEQAAEKLFNVPLPDAGYTLVVRPLSPLTKRALWLQARVLHPDPDPRQYDRTVENALAPGQVSPGEDSPEYKAALTLVQSKQKAWVDVWTIQSGVVVDVKEGSKEKIIARFASVIAQLRALLKSAVPEDAWTATVMYALLSTRRDVGAVLNAADDAITEGEVRQALDTFPG